MMEQAITKDSQDVDLADASDHSASTIADADRKDERDVIAQQEGRFVFVFRALVVTVLVLSAIAVCLGVYFYATGNEKSAFETKFDSDATKILETIGTSFEQTLGSTDAFITQLVAYARYSNSSWPYVTMPAFAIHATKLLKLSKAFYFTVFPFVEPWQYDEWIAYSNKTNGWIYESLDIQAHDKSWWGPKQTSFTPVHEIFADHGRPKDKPYDYMNNFLPSWQVHPMVPNRESGHPYNYDIWDVQAMARGILYADMHKRVVVTPQVNAIYDSTSEQSIAAAESNNRFASNYIRPGLDPSEPFSVIIFPIYDSLETVSLDLTKNHTFVGISTFCISWREHIQNILPEGSDGAIVVFEDQCGPAFTYRLDGPKATFLGTGDLHDPAYDAMKYSAQLPDMANVHGETDGSYSTYTGLPLAEDFCPRTISVYASSDMEDVHKTADPLLFTIAAACIFLFTSILFMVYDFWVNRRQRIVMQRALASGAIVSSLFPENVRQQLYKEEEQKKESEKAVKDFLLSSNSINKGDDSPLEGNGSLNSRPIADYFENTTILFGDLVGFTNWSASRQPVEVFELLESIYGQFDKIARRRKVFKVETIGDCYVAVTGVPNPQKHHSSIMAKFASECMMELQQVTHNLADKLGEETLKLSMRVGLHSGPVTAGVLRGEKGRFQLFGGTVNAAARMEQNGSPGKIHGSQEYADALRTDGKGHWLVPRDDKIVAKGLGELDTFWVVMINGADTMSHATGMTHTNSMSSDGPAIAVPRHSIEETNDETSSNLEKHAEDSVDV